MKNLSIYCVIINLLVLRGFSQDNINTSEYFPDENFRRCVEQFMNVEPGGVITADEASSATGELRCVNQGIESLKGIEFFTSIYGLSCWDNQLTSLDLTKNKSLTNLSCFRNSISDLRITNVTTITDIYCSWNQLQELDIYTNISLQKLNCVVNRLQELDVSNNKKLQRLSCIGNELKHLDVSMAVSLSYLDCSFNHISQLTLNSNLNYIDSRHNQLTELDITPLEMIFFLDLRNNQITNISEFLNVPFSEFAAFDLRNNTISSNQCQELLLLQNRLGEPLFTYPDFISEPYFFEDFEDLDSGFIFSPQLNNIELDCISQIQNWDIH